MQASSPSDNTSWWDDLIGALSQKQVPPPPAPQPPPVNQGAWAQSVDRAKISPNLSVHDLGLIVFNESQSYSDRPDSNEPIDTAREKMTHSVMNADQERGAARMDKARTALPIEPSTNALANPATRAAYDSSMKAAREAYLSGADPTNGAVYFVQKKTADRSNNVFHNGKPEGVPISTQSGPYNNSYTKGQMPSGTAWLNTYWPK